MKKKKGFTLIELLAVIVVLAIILVLAVPKILDVIENADKQAYKESAELMAHTAQIQYQTKEVTGSAPVIPEEGITYYYYNNKQVKSFEDGEKEIEITKTDDNYLNFKGDRPFSGTITLTKDKKVIISDLISKNKKWCVKKEATEKQARVGRRTDPEFNCKIEGEDEVVIEDKVACELETNDDKTEYYIDSPCDLYEFSNRVNSGEDFSGKVVKVRNNLDMDLEKINANSDLVKKMKDNYGTTDFSPIGTSTNQFMGTFDGGAKTISNLTINKPSSSNIGLFGYLKSATVYGLNLYDINITGKDNVGLIGQIKGADGAKANVYAISTDKVTIAGNSYVGGVVGTTGNQYVEAKEILFNELNITGTSFVAGVFGQNNNAKFNNILIKNMTLTGSSTLGLFEREPASVFLYVSNSIVENANIITNGGGCYLGNSSSYSNLVTVDGTVKTSGFDSKGINDINYYESLGLDTWIGLDDNNTGYYFDYNYAGEIILKNVIDDPFPSSTKILSSGSGTENDPYLITNEDDWKKVAAYAGFSEIYYKLENDLDFSTKKYYMLGSNITSNNFNSVLYGNDKTIRNVEINGNKGNYLGIIGNLNQGVLYALNLENVTIVGNNYVGLIGSMKGAEGAKANVYAISTDKVTIAGNSYVGGVVGTTGNQYVEAKEILFNELNITGTSFVAGVFGQNNNAKFNNILIKNMTLTGSSTLGLFEREPASVFLYVSNSIVENANIITNGGGCYLGNSENRSNLVTVDGTVKTTGFDSSYIDDIYYYKGIVETVFTGDANGTGYFFDLMDDGKIRLVKAYTLEPSYDESTGETTPGICSIYPCTCECGCDCGPSNGEVATRCQEGCNPNQ